VTDHACGVPGYGARMSEDETEAFRTALKRVAVVLKDSGVAFALAGGYAAWARGGPESGHDVDFMVRGDDAAEVATALEKAGLEVVRPPEDWLFKTRSDGVTVDLLLRSAGGDLDDVLAAAEELPVLSVRMPVMTATDVVADKLCALDEHYCDLGAVLPTLRALREQVDWDVVRRRAKGRPFAEATLFLLERLEVVAET